MDEFQGVHLIDRDGINHGIIERNFYSPNIGKYIIHYKAPIKGYQVCYLDKDEYDRFQLYARLRDERYIIMRNRDIRHIYHFSPIANTESILNYGLISREFAKQTGIPIEITDPLRLDGELDKISASISFPNYKMRYKLKQQENANLVIYDINPRLLLARLDTQFYYTNAANAIFQTKDKKTLTSNQAFKDMFYSSGREPGLLDRYTTDPQAEILVTSNIPNTYIEEVISETYEPEVDALCQGKQKKYDYATTIYGPRGDWRRWQNGN